MFRKILIANRGEIALRIIATCREMNIDSVAVYSEADQHSRHVINADEAYLLGPAPAQQSYLNGDAILDIARRSGAEAIHPGYGFLSENADFAEACEQAGIVFIGPGSASIRLMGSKTAARRVAQQVNAPTVPGYNGESQMDGILQEEGERIGFPLLIKAVAGGGGKGMRIVHHAATFLEQLAGARREAQAAFGDAAVFLERYLQQARHIEIQILADQHGNVVHLGERECSIQRRHQKIIEESPSSVLSDALRQQMGDIAIRIARAACYVNAGTLEFILDTDQNFYFLEMNTRLQVEHPVTELVTGLDMVRQQLYIAAGEPLKITQAEISPRGHAIEARFYAEDPQQHYLPSTGIINAFHKPVGPGIRLDSGIEAGDEITQYYDPMLAKLIVVAESRQAAIQRLQRALEQSAIFGVKTNLELLHAISQHPAFAMGDTPTDFLEQHDLLAPTSTADISEDIFKAAAIYDLQHLATEKSSEYTMSATSKHRLTPWQTQGLWRIAGGRRTLSYRYGEQDYLVTIQPVVTRQNTWSISVGEQAPQEITAFLTNDHFLMLRCDDQQTLIALHDQKDELHLILKGKLFRLRRPGLLDVTTASHGGDQQRLQNSLTAPMSGTIVKIEAHDGDIVEAHQTLVILSAMKMEHAITAPYAGKIKHISCAEGDVVQGGTSVVEMEAANA
ncbi:acetyl/propionyl/methylcrotonyl-CoA carboxylase subunit alpha [Dictyobacter arantiisoli]|uniref:Biotin-dependent 3-methylcrotonyl-coenzyme A carboxylase alpha1 subunit n=1 Tax=Dictyobacter arantiisoli TaxID=2014874 RepID=A0A5A5TGA0_9CHLR|nr:acetyl-CoA carboxylase biotin carboxylase subunit [Dictyobacter arantiisoli]GCF10093.1 3-methylcrotonoyl-CoA carboxylase subunit alpha [Dictyobacter arantiisoli]